MFVNKYFTYLESKNNNVPPSVHYFYIKRTLLADFHIANLLNPANLLN